MILRRILPIILMPLALTGRGINNKLIPVYDGYAATSVNTAVFRANSLVSDSTAQYIAFYNSDGFLTIGKRNLDSDRWTINVSKYRGRVEDAHNTISIMLDGDNYLHVAFDHHGDTLKYCRSLLPGGIELGDLTAMVGTLEDDVTYPEFYKLSTGDLLFAYRHGASGRGNLVLNRYDVANQTWYRLQDVLIDGENERNAYWQIFVDKNDKIHISWVWRESWLVETNHDLCYACSSDGGLTWQRSDSTEYVLPITEATAEKAWCIPQNSELINQTSMTTDSDGHPYIATYWRDADSDIPQYRLVWHDGNDWHARQISNLKTKFSLSGGGTKMIPISRPRIATDGRKIYYIVRESERQSRVSLYSGQLNEEQLKVSDLTDFSVDAWEPSYDTELWKSRNKLHIFVQRTSQGDGEKVTDLPPQMVYVLEVE
ncbi:MAG: BNR repeat-containing protein [Muribaculaceae bacterium]|nr:BNR repeat-containing protein [Muribaculaceae bacterium]